MSSNGVPAAVCNWRMKPCGHTPPRSVLSVDPQPPKAKIHRELSQGLVPSLVGTQMHQRTCSFGAPHACAALHVWGGSSRRDDFMAPLLAYDCDVISSLPLAPRHPYLHVRTSDSSQCGPVASPNDSPRQKPVYSRLPGCACRGWRAGSCSTRHQARFPLRARNGAVNPPPRQTCCMPCVCVYVVHVVVTGQSPPSGCLFLVICCAGPASWSL